MSEMINSETAQPSEAEMAQEWKQACLKGVRAAKHFRLSIAVALVLFAGTLTWLGFKDWPVIILGAAFIPFLMYLDARGHEREVQDRPGLKLVPGFNRVFGPDGRRLTGGATESKPANAS